MTTMKEGITELVGSPDEWVQSCQHCGAKLLTFKGVLAAALLEEKGDMSFSGLPGECQCPQAVAERKAAETEERKRAEEERIAELNRRRNRRFENSGMPEQWKSRSLTMWQCRCRDDETALRVAQNVLAEAMRPGGKPRSLYICGDIGTGKTMLASCLARDLHRQLVWVQWANVGAILAELRACNKPGSRTDSEAVLNKYKRSAALVLDDLGKERPTEWATEQIFNILNHRYEHDLPTFITTNYGSKQLVRRLTPTPPPGDYADDTTAQAIVDRLREMCESVVLTGESRRIRE